MPFYYAGFNTSTFFTRDNGQVILAVDRFSEIPFVEITDFQIGWSYFLLWKGNELYFSGKIKDNIHKAELIETPEKCISFKLAATGKNNIIVLTVDNEMWQYRIYENSWRKVANFISNNDGSENEYPVKILQEGCTIALTNLGRVFNVPTLVEMPKRVRFIDVACGFDHTILLADNGDLYSMGMGTRGQLGHGDLEDCDNPKLIEALAGIKVIQISAGGWHSAVITNQGDLYTWGWNTNGELGILASDIKVMAVPTLVDFKSEQGEFLELSVQKVECGNTFTICQTDNGILWGSGSNKYAQWGQSQQIITESSIFVKLDIHLDPKIIKNYKCHEWGTLLVTN